MTHSAVTQSILALSLSVAAWGETFVFRHENVLGTEMELRIEASTQSAANAAEKRTLAEIDRLAGVLSTYRADSEISRWLGTHEATVVSADLAAVLRACDFWEKASGGAFNPRVEALSQLWKDGVPHGDALAATVEKIALPAWNFRADAVQRSGDCPVSVNALAKGYIISKAGACAFQQGAVDGVLLNIGGDLQSWGDAAHTVSIAAPGRDAENAAPLAQTVVRSQAVATSGDYHRTVGGHSHIFDPRTGRPAGRVHSASVRAGDAVTADALATIFNVLEVAESVRLAESIPGVACLIVSDSGVTRSANWEDAPAAQLAQNDHSCQGAAPAVAAAENWGDRRELLVNYEIAMVEGGRYHRPYLAIWLEDKDGKPVRTLMLNLKQGEKGKKWLPDLKRWNRNDKTRADFETLNLVVALSSATKNPGQHSVIWDGLDDAKKPVKPGTYTLYIEAAREHGTYQLMKQEVAVGGPTDFKNTMEGNIEIKGATIEYRAKPAK